MRIPPPGLAMMQEQFGKSIRTPFSFSTGRFQCKKHAYSDWAAESINPREAQTGRDRLAVYNEQYWYRLLTVLQNDFPLLAGTMGLWEFNQLATAFLDQQPSRSPYLQNLPNGFVEFLSASPNFNIPRLVQIATLETAFHNAFHAPTAPPLDPAKLSARQLEMLAGAPLVFQPWLSLLEEEWNLMECRTGLVEKGIETPIFIARKGFWAIFRSGNEVEWKELDPLQFNLLNRLRSGQPLGSACEAMAENLDTQEVASLMAQMPSWFETWTRLKWFQQPLLEGLIDGHAEVV
ncbi:MAG: DNA-binding domain-containing protein [Fibrobacteria bacterium]